MTEVREKPGIVRYAREGVLSLLKSLCEADKTPQVINESGKTRKTINNKVSETHDDTALIAAARNSHLEVVLYLI